MSTTKQIITVRGHLGADPKLVDLPSGATKVEFRVASTDRKFNADTREWEDGNTNWYTVQAFRNLATNVHRSLSKGDPVIVTGKLNVRQWTSKDGEKSGTAVEILADSIGHDLTRGYTQFWKTTGSASSFAGSEAGAGSTNGGPGSFEEAMAESFAAEAGAGEVPGAEQPAA